MQDDYTLKELQKKFGEIISQWDGDMPGGKEEMSKEADFGLGLIEQLEMVMERLGLKEVKKKQD
jgi:hypothetical protein